MDPATILAAIPVALLLVGVGWLKSGQTRMSDRLDNVYTKAETEKLIDLKTKPLADALQRNEDALQRNTESQHELTQAIQDLRIAVAKLGRE